jgi:hypothetical protein
MWTSKKARKMSRKMHTAVFELLAPLVGQNYVGNDHA